MSFNHHVFTSINKIFIEDNDSSKICHQHSGHDYIGKIDITFLGSTYNSFKEFDFSSKFERDKTISTWFVAGYLILFKNKENKKLISVYIGASLGSTNYIFSGMKWHFAYDSDYNLIISDYLSVNNDKVKHIGYVTNCQVAWIRAAFKHDIDLHNNGQKITFQYSTTSLASVLSKIGDLFVTNKQNYNSLLNYTDKVEQTKVEQDKVEQIKTEQAEQTKVEQVKVNQVEQVKVDYVENMGDKCCTIAFEYYLVMVKSAFSVEKRLKDMERNAKEGHVNVTYILNKYTSIAFQTNSENLMKNELKNIILKMFENFKTKMDKEGFNVFIKEVEDEVHLITESQINQTVIDKLTKKYVV